MPKALISALLTGLLSSALFLIVFGTGLGFVFMFLPTLPLFFLGLSRKSQMNHLAIISAAIFISIAAGEASGILFLIFLGFPTWYFAKKTTLCAKRPELSDTVWFPLGTILLNLTLYACSLIALMTWYYHDETGGLPQLLAENIHEAFADLEGDYGDIISRMANGWSFLMFPITIWLWGMLLYAHAWLANRGLNKYHGNTRPDMTIQPFPIPSWMLTLLAICALATLIGGTSMSFLGKSSLLSLMLPYFFLGCTLMHRACKSWPSSRFFIFFIYFLIFTQFWPVLILAFLGLWHQIKSLSGSGTWSKS